jgi:hypothetical protein
MAGRNVAGGVLIAVVLATSMKRRSAKLARAAGLVTVAVGAWMTVTHLDVSLDAIRGEDDVGVSGAAYHMLPALGVLVFGLAWLIRAIRYAGPTRRGP